MLMRYLSFRSRLEVPLPSADGLPRNPQSAQKSVPALRWFEIYCAVWGFVPPPPIRTASTNWWDGFRARRLRQRTASRLALLLVASDSVEGTCPRHAMPLSAARNLAGSGVRVVPIDTRLPHVLPAMVQVSVFRGKEKE